MSDRVSSGLAGLSIQWPAIMEVGMAASYNMKGLALDILGVKSILSNVVQCDNLSMRDYGGILIIYPKAIHSDVMNSKLKDQFEDVSIPTVALVEVHKPSANLTKKGNQNIISTDQVFDLVNSAVLNLLSVSSINADDQFEDIGLDSLRTTELASILSTVIGIKILPSVVLNYTTVNELVHYLIENMRLKKSSNSSVDAVINAADNNQIIDNDIIGVEGIILESCPIFSNYLCNIPKVRIILFSALGQPPNSWHFFARYFMQHGIDAHIVQLPGRFDRINDQSIDSMEEIVTTVCTSIKSMHWLDSNAIPIAFMGFSYGTYIAYECIKYLEKSYQYNSLHLLSVAGIAIEQLRLFPGLEEMPGDTMAEKLRHQFLATHGKEPPKFGHKGFSTILEPMVAGNNSLVIVVRTISDYNLYRY